MNEYIAWNINFINKTASLGIKVKINDKSNDKIDEIKQEIFNNIPDVIIPVVLMRINGFGIELIDYDLQCK